MQSNDENTRKSQLNNFLSSPRLKINETDDEKPINNNIQPFETHISKNFKRNNNEPVTKSLKDQRFSDYDSNSSESSLDDYTIAKKNVRTMHDSNQSSKKKIDTLTEAPLKSTNAYRNSKIISFGNKQNTQHNFTEYVPEKTAIIKEEGEIEKIDDDLPKNHSIISNKKNFLDPGSPSKSPRKSKLSGENSPINTVNNNLTSNENSSSPTVKKIHSKLYKLISEFYIVKKFMTSLINATIYRKPKKLKDFHYNIINDWACFQQKSYHNKDEENIKKSCWYKIGDNFVRKLSALKKNHQNFAKLLKFLYKTIRMVFYPSNYFKIIWDLLHLALIFIYLIIIPLKIGFDINILDYYSSANPDLFSSFKTFSICFFLLDILVTMNTAYYEKGELITKRETMIINYLKTQFLWDILSLIFLFEEILDLPLFSNEISSAGAFKLFGVLFLSRISNMNKILSRIEEFLFIEEKFYNILSLIRLIFFVIFVSHIFACAWHYIAYDPLTNHKGTWLEIYGLIGESWWIRYLYSFYYVVVAMNTVGFGDIVPQTYFERVYSIFFIYVACGIFAYTINCIGLILQDINKKKNDLKRTVLLINSYMKQKNINIDLRIRIRKYIEYIWQEERVQNDVETHDIINKLSKTLKEELMLNVNGVVLREFPLFYMNFSEVSLRKLVYHIEEISLTPGDLIYTLNELDPDNCIYIIRKGEVELFVETPRSSRQSVTVLKTLKTNELFGEYSFFSEMPRETCARSSSFTTLFVIKKEVFLSIIKGNSDDYEIYCQLKDRINLYKETDGLYSNCSSCQQNDHNIMNCPLLHLTLSKYRILQRYNHSKPQTRESVPRKLKKTAHALKNFEKNENIAQKFSHDLNSEEDSDDSSDVSSNELKMQIKREFNRLSSDITNSPSNNTILASNEEKNASSSPKFRETQKQKSILRFPSKINNEIDNSFSNNNISITSAVQNNSNLNISGIRKSRSYNRKKPGTTVVPSMHRQNSKDSMSKNSIYSKKSSKSNKSIKFFPYEVSLTQNTTEEQQKKLALPKDMRSPIRKFSNISSIRQNTNPDDLSEYMLLYRKNRYLQEPSEASVRSKSHKSKESKSKKSSNKTQEKEMGQGFGALEKPQTTLFDLDKANYEDIAKSYEFYFPYNNLESVIEKIKSDNLVRRKKKLTKVGTKNDFNNFFAENMNFMAGQTQNLNKFNRRGGKINIFKTTNNFFKRRMSQKKTSFRIDKKKLALMINKGPNSANSNGCLSRITDFCRFIWQKTCFNLWEWMKNRFGKARKNKKNKNLQVLITKI